LYFLVTAKEKPAQGIVESVGPGQTNDVGNIIPTSVKVGDKVLFAKWGGTEVKIENRDFLIMKESDILGII
jgi:chaperonin GroES